MRYRFIGKIFFTGFLIFSHSFLLSQVAPPPIGTWEGKLKAAGTELRIIFQIKAGEKGHFLARMASPDQGANNIPVDSVVWKNDTIELYVKAVGGSYIGTYMKDSLAFNGHWNQMGASFPLSVSRTEKVDFYPKRPQEPTRPYPYKEEEVRYENTQDSIVLGGTVTLPKGKGPFPAVILISGSGSQNRDEEIMGHKPFLVLSDYLTRKGIAVLRYDDRGIGQSTGTAYNATTADYAKDAMAGFNYLKTRTDIDKNKIGLIGHSEGGLIALIVANKINDVAFMVLMATPGFNGELSHRLQTKHLLEKSGADQAYISKTLGLNDRVYELLKKEKDSLVLASKLTELFAKDSIMQHVDATPTIKQYTSSWFRYFINFDPQPLLHKVTCPILAINGSKDIQVAAKENLAAISNALSRGGNRKVKVKELRGLNHLFQTAITGDMSEYTKIDETFSPVALHEIGQWIDEIRW